MTESPESFAAEMYRRRKALGLSVVHLGDLSGVDKATVFKVETDEERTPRPATQEAIRQALASVEADPSIGEAAKERARLAAAEKRGTTHPGGPTYTEPAEFAEWLTSTGRALGYLSNASLARALGIQQSNISRWKNHLSQPGVEHLLRISELFGVHLEALLVLSGYIAHEKARISTDDLHPRLPEGHVSVSAVDLMTVLSGAAAADPQDYVAALTRLLSVVRGDMEEEATDG